jgi:hypothetical protein
MEEAETDEIAALLLFLSYAVSKQQGTTSSFSGSVARFKNS